MQWPSVDTTSVFPQAQPEQDISFTDMLMVLASVAFIHQLLGCNPHGYFKSYRCHRNHSQHRSRSLSCKSTSQTLLLSFISKKAS